MNNADIAWEIVDSLKCEHCDEYSVDPIALAGKIITALDNAEKDS